MVRRFRPTVLPTIVVVAMSAVLLSLGTWQLNRAEEKRALINSYTQVPDKPPVSFADVMVVGKQESGISRVRYRRIQVQGRFDSGRHILLDNQLRNREPGYMVFTPFYVLNSDVVLLVNRGWLAKPVEDAQLLRIDDEQPTVVTGLINHAPGVGFKMGSLDDSGDGWPRILPYIDMDWLAHQFDGQLMSWIILLDPEAEYGFERMWEPVIRMTPEKHQGYALQWYSLAIVLIFLFVAGSLRPEGGQVGRNTGGLS